MEVIATKRLRKALANNKSRSQLALAITKPTQDSPTVQIGAKSYRVRVVPERPSKTKK